MAPEPIVYASNEEYKFFPNSTGSCVFRVKTDTKAEIRLSNQAITEFYDLTIGENHVTLARKYENQGTSIRLDQIATPYILSKCEYRGFWMRWKPQFIDVGQEGDDKSAFLSLTYNVDDIPISKIGFRTFSPPFIGSWIIADDQGLFGCEGKGDWLPYSDGNVPPNAFIGGIEEAIYVVRCKYNNAVIPGKLVTDDKTAYFPAEGEEKATRQYEVLCDFSGSWMRVTGANIPKNAFRAGHDATDEPLYVGRVFFEQKHITGKVQRSDCKCYISLGGKEHPLTDYEILLC